MVGEVFFCRYGIICHMQRGIIANIIIVIIGIIFIAILIGFFNKP